jgi:hypothetical protein
VGLFVALCAAGACILPPTTPSDAALPTLSECGLAPNYVNSSLADQPPARLLRWRTFPVRLYVDVRDVPDTLAGLYREAAERGATAWDTATGGRVGRFQHVDAPSRSQVIVRFRSGIGNSAATTAQFSGRLLIQTTTEVGRPGRDGELVGLGRGAQVSQTIEQIVSHEMGHALGILLHSPNPGDLMAQLIRVGSGGNVITAADRHTVLQAYCE